MNLSINKVTFCDALLKHFDLNISYNFFCFKMAQSEAGKSVRTVANEEPEEEFGPQLITKLEVCTI